MVYDVVDLDELPGFEEEWPNANGSDGWLVLVILISPLLQVVWHTLMGK